MQSNSSNPNFTAMASNGSDSSSSSEILHSFLFFDVLKDGRIKFLTPPYPIHITPPADDPLTGVKIKDVKISAHVSARIFLPPSAASSTAKLPVLLYIHGGGFCFHSAFSAEYTRILTGLVAQGKIIAVSVEYRLFPSAAIAACYDDSWAALQWVISHATGAGPDSWLNLHADFNRLFIGGDSAGGNISHALAVRAGSGGLPGGVTLEGMILIHPYFKEDDKMWLYMWGPSNEGPRDRRMWPHPEDLGRVGCGRVLVVLAERDLLRDAGKFYAEELRRSRWEGTVEIMENKDKEHCFHLRNHEDEEALAIQRRIISFIYHQD